jgi:hypothetical protein
MAIKATDTNSQTRLSGYTMRAQQNSFYSKLTADECVASMNLTE